MKGLVAAVKRDDATASRRLTVLTVWLWQDPSWTSAFDLGSDFPAMCYTPRAPLGVVDDQEVLSATPSRSVVMRGSLN